MILFVIDELGKDNFITYVKHYCYHLCQTLLLSL